MVSNRCWNIPLLKPLRGLFRVFVPTVVLFMACFLAVTAYDVLILLSIVSVFARRALVLLLILLSSSGRHLPWPQKPEHLVV